MATTRAKANLPVNYEEQLAKEAAEITKRIAAPTGDRIRFNANRAFITPDGMEGETLEVVIVNFVSSNLFYDGLFDRDNPSSVASCIHDARESGRIVRTALTSAIPRPSVTKTWRWSRSVDRMVGAAGRGLAARRVPAQSPARARGGPSR